MAELKDRPDSDDPREASVGYLAASGPDEAKPSSLSCPSPSPLPPASSSLASSHHPVSLIDYLLLGGFDAEVYEKPYPGSGTPDDPYIVDYLQNDRQNAMNFTNGRKWAISVLQSLSTFAVTFSSSVYASGIEGVEERFHVSGEVATLGLSLFVLGFAIGPLLWAPLSETCGRQSVYVVSFVVYTAFCVGATCAQNIESLLILRFLASAFGSSSMTNTGGVIADMFDKSQRGMATGLFVTAPFLGPAFGMTFPYLDIDHNLADRHGPNCWRLPRRETGLEMDPRPRLHPRRRRVHCHDADDTRDVRPVYPPPPRHGSLPGLRPRLPVPHRRVQPAAVAVGGARRVPHSALAHALPRAHCALHVRLHCHCLRDAVHVLCRVPDRVPGGPRLEPGRRRAGVYRRGHWRVPGDGDGGRGQQAVRQDLRGGGSGQGPAAGAGGPAGDGHGGLGGAAGRAVPVCVDDVSVDPLDRADPGGHVVFVRPGAGVYLADELPLDVVYAASVLAANSVIRSLFGAAFPLFTTQMYAKLGNQWASSIPAFLVIGCFPFPFLFYKYGPRIRAKCKYAAEAARVLEIMNHRQGEAEASSSQEKSTDETV